MTFRMAVVILALILCISGPAFAASWVASPTPVSGSLGDFQAGDACCAWVNTSGNQLLFFDIWSGSWTELTLPETHTFVRIEAAGNLVLVLFDDLAVAFDGPDASAHVLPLDGALLDTSYNQPSFGCGDVLAAVCTDAEFAVFDSAIDSWRVLEYTFPGDYSGHRGTVLMDDYVAAVLGRTSGFGNLNLAYSRRTRTFVEEPDGVYDILNGSYVLDHGFYGFLGSWPNYQLKGYSAFTGQLTLGAVSVGGGLGPYPVSRDRRELCHLGGGAEFHSPAPYEGEIHIWIYDTITADWEYTTYSYNTPEGGASGHVDIGGRFVSHMFQDETDNSYDLLFFAGHDHSWTWNSPGLFGSGIGRILGGSVVAYSETFPPGQKFWWCRSDQSGSGRYTSSSREFSCCVGAGEQWFSTGQYSNGDPLMDLFFYHGPTNTLLQVETWRASQTINHAGTNVHCLVATGGDTQVNFFSGLLGTVEQRTDPSGAYLTTLINENVALAYNNGVVDYLFDARTGVVQSRGVDFSASSLGVDVVIGNDGAGNVAHGYSALTESWSTQSIGTAGYAYAGDQVGLFRTQNGMTQWGFSALDNSWTELAVTGTFPSQIVGGRTIIVRSSNGLWAFWPLDGVAAVEDDEPLRATTLAHALGQAYCAPNPFNGRTVIRFDLPLAAYVLIEVFDVRGARVATLVQEARQPGRITAIWSTDRVASGTYLVRIGADGQAVTKKIALVQ